LVVGSISSEIGRLSNLFTLEIYNNLLSGTFPESLWTITALEILEIAEAGMYGKKPAVVSVFVLEFTIIGNCRNFVHQH
jgi:hypothetical protein